MNNSPQRLGIPVLLNFGPQYLRNFEQVYKGGPSMGLFLILAGTAGDLQETKLRLGNAFEAEVWRAWGPKSRRCFGISEG